MEISLQERSGFSWDWDPSEAELWEIRTFKTWLIVLFCSTKIIKNEELKPEDSTTKNG